MDPTGPESPVCAAPSPVEERASSPDAEGTSPSETTASPRPALERRVSFDTVGKRLFGRWRSERLMCGRFVVHKTLGQGGMGTVFEAHDPKLDRRVAIKQMHGRLSSSRVDRLRREAQALAKLSHPNVVQIYEVAEQDARCFIAMELIRGETLRQWQEREHGWRDRVRMYLQAGAGLAAAHAVGLVHRDFKPDNCILDEQERLRVVDFGLARDTVLESKSATDDVDTTRAPADRSWSDCADAWSRTSQTRTGSVMGTAGYIPPESFLGAPIDATGDQFSFCVALYESLFGVLPFPVSARGEQSDEGPRPPPRGTPVPGRVGRVVMRGLARDPRARWPTMDALLDALARATRPNARRGLALGVGGGIVAVSAVVVAAVVPRDAAPCEGAADRLRGVWDDAHRQRVRSAILATGLSYAEDTAQLVDEDLDGYARDLVSKQVEICEAANMRHEISPHEMDLRMRCLERHYVGLEQIVEILTSANETRVENAEALVDGLPSLARCDDIDALRATLPRPEDPALVQQVGALQRRLERSSALYRAGEFAQGLTLAEAVLREAEALGHPPLVIESLLQRGRSHKKLDHFAQAQRDLERCHLLAAEHEHPAAAAAAVELVFVERVGQARPEAALRWGRTALALARRHPAEPRLEADALATIGDTLADQGRSEAALVALRDALALLQDELGPRHPDVGLIHQRIGNVYVAQGALDEALEQYGRALASYEEGLGPRHPQLASCLQAIGTAYTVGGQWEQGLESLERALAISVAARGAEHSKVGYIQHSIGGALLRQGKIAESLDRYRRALDIFEKVLGSDHPLIAAELNNIAVGLQNQGKLDEALTHHRRSLAIKRQALGAAHSDIALSIVNIGEILLQQGKLDEAQVEYQAGLDMFDQTVPPDYGHRAFALLGLATIALERGELDHARDYAERAIAISASSQLALGEVPARARFVLARALFPDPAQRSRAVSLARAALEELDALGPEIAARASAEVSAWLEDHA